jgi:hypothetical protein
MELHPPVRVNAEAVRRCRRYLDQLPLPAERKRALLELAQTEADPDRAMAKLHHALSGASRLGEEGTFASIRRRLECAVPGVNARRRCAEADDASPLPTTPRLHRTPMASTGWPVALGVSILHGLRARLPRRSARSRIRARPRRTGSWRD